MSPRDCNRPLIITVHGWNSGGMYMKFFNPYFEQLGYKTYNYEYGWMLAASLRNGNIAKRILSFVRFAHDVCGVDSIIVAHSNGCVVSNYAAWMSPYIKGLVLVNAALENDVEFPPTLAFIHNWYSPSDRVVRLAALIPFHYWGNLGARPYQGVSPQVKNFNKEHDYELSSDDHSDIFQPALREYFMPKMALEVEKEILASPIFFA